MTTQLVPHPTQLRLCLQVALHELQGRTLCAVGGVSTLQAHDDRALTVLLKGRRDPSGGAPIPTGHRTRGVQGQPVVHAHAGQLRPQLGKHLLAVGHQFQPMQVAAELQRIRDHVVGKLGGLVEWRHTEVKTRRLEQMAVQHDVAVNVPHAGFSQFQHQGPQLRQAQFQIGTAAQQQIALEPSSFDGCGGSQLGIAAQVRAHAIQRYRTRDHLHG